MGSLLPLPLSRLTNSLSHRRNNLLVMFLVWLRLKFLVQRLTHFLRAQKFTGPLSCQRLRGDRDARRAL